MIQVYKIWLIPDFIKSSNSCNLLRGIENVGHWPLHVGLAGTNPNVSKKNIRDSQGDLTLLAYYDLTYVGLWDWIKDNRPAIVILQLVNGLETDQSCLDHLRELVLKNTLLAR